MLRCTLPACFLLYAVSGLIYVLSEGSEFPSGLSDKALAVASLVVVGTVAGAFTILALIWSCVSENDVMMLTWKVSPDGPINVEKSAGKQSETRPEVPNITVDAAVNTSHYSDIVPASLTPSHSSLTTTRLSPTPIQSSLAAGCSSLVIPTAQSSVACGQSSLATSHSSLAAAPYSWEVIQKCR